MTKIRVLVVDDSAFLRRNLPRILESDPSIEVIGTAANGVEAVRMVKELRPDVVTLDVMMPRMDGLTALKTIMRQAPTPVVMVSATTREGARETFEALTLGAVDFVTKPSGPLSLDIESVRSQLLEKIRVAYSAKAKFTATGDTTGDRFRAVLRQLSGGKPQPATKPHLDSRPPDPKRLVALAASTGGPAALQMVLPRLPANLNAGMVIVQHIAPGFAQPLAERLNSLSHIAVREAENRAPITPGSALLAPAGFHLTVEHETNGLVARLSTEPTQTLHRPSADVLFHSIAECCAPETCAVILTGMGDDGAKGMRSIRDKGGWTVAQDEATSVIYGMPRRAVELGGVDASLPVDQIASAIVQATTGSEGDA